MQLVLCHDADVNMGQSWGSHYGNLLSHCGNCSETEGYYGDWLVVIYPCLQTLIISNHSSHNQQPFHFTILQQPISCMKLVFCDVLQLCFDSPPTPCRDVGGCWKYGPTCCHTGPHWLEANWNGGQYWLLRHCSDIFFSKFLTLDTHNSPMRDICLYEFNL